MTTGALVVLRRCMTATIDLRPVHKSLLFFGYRLQNCQLARTQA
ncbi:hypothetical protein ILFOPFJJ_06237 [Ensifer psoraleae]|nr:hypothetical protein [Sinorhizobium psoraleae]